jgi:hypothetical protein
MVVLLSYIGVLSVVLLVRSCLDKVVLFGSDQNRFIFFVTEGNNMLDETSNNATKLVMDLCFRIERMCRYSPLDDKEIDDQSMKDRNIVAGLYQFFKNKGDDQNLAAKKARANAIRLVLNEVFS